MKPILLPCTCVINGSVTGCERHDPIIGFVPLKSHVELKQVLTGMRSAPNGVIEDDVGVPEGLVKPAGTFDPDNYGTTGAWPRDEQMGTDPKPGAVYPTDAKGQFLDPKPPTERVIHAEMGIATFRPVQTASAVPEIGPLSVLIAATRLIPTQPTTEQWQTLKQAILDLERS